VLTNNVHFESFNMQKYSVIWHKDGKCLVTTCDRQCVSNLTAATTSPIAGKCCSVSAQDGCAVACEQFRAVLTDGPTPKQGRAATTDCPFFRPCFALTHAPSVHKDGIALEGSAVSRFLIFVVK